MDDADGQVMARWFYEELMKKETIELDDIPYALDVAVGKLRKLAKREARQWATYMHIGA